MDSSKWKVVPVTLTEEMHKAAVIAVCRSHGNDDFPPNTWAAMLDAAPEMMADVTPPPTSRDRWFYHQGWIAHEREAAAPQPPSASDERDWTVLNATIQTAWVQSVEDASPHFNGSREQSFRDGYLAALDTVARSPGVDAAEPIGYASDDGMEALSKFGQCSIVAGPARSVATEYVHPLYAAPSPAASADEWKSEAERLVWNFSAAVGRQLAEQGSSVGSVEARTALLAHLKARP